MTNEQVQWLIIEGLVPLFGAGLIYVIMGMIEWVTTPVKANFKYSWQESLDSMGWLYGALIIAIQAFLRCVNAKVAQTSLVIASGVGGVFCLLILITAMSKRGSNQNWQPPNSMKVVAIILAVSVLIIGCTARALEQKDAAKTDGTVEQTAPAQSSTGGHK